MISCSGVPEESYKWHPELQLGHVQLKELMSHLPLGEPSYTNYLYQRSGWEKFVDKFKKDNSFTISNAHQLSCFMNDADWDEFDVNTLVTYNEISPSFAVAILFSEGKSPKLKKEKYCIAGSMFGGSGLDYYTKEVQGLEGLSSNCIFHVVWEKNDAGNYVTLSGKDKNLYVEFAIPGDINPKEKRNPLDDFFYFRSPEPYEAVNDWKQPVIQKLIEAHEASKLNVCQFPDV